MNKLASWFRSGLGRFAFFRRKAEADGEEPAPSVLPDSVVETRPSADVVAEEAEVQPAGLWSRLTARFRKQAAVDADPAVVAEEPALAAADGEVEKPAGFWSRLAARISRRGAAVADLPEPEGGAGEPERRIAGTPREKLPHDGEGEAEQPAGLWSRLVARFRKRTAAPDDESATVAPDAKAGRGKAGEGDAGRRRTPHADDVLADGDEPPRSGLRGLGRKKLIGLSLLLLVFGVLLAGGWFALEQWQASSAAQAKALQQSNQALAEQNKKLKAENAKLAKEQSKPRVAGETAKSVASPQSGDANANANAGADADCTVGDKASVRDSLKGCIDSFNAASGR